MLLKPYNMSEDAFLLSLCKQNGFTCSMKKTNSSYASNNNWNEFFSSTMI